jgi:GT2 family glycosyltransferase
MLSGLAGATKCDLNAQMMAWHLMAPRESFVGEVAHSNGGITWTTVFGQTPARALVIDGLFIAVNVDALLSTGTRFDEDFDFHHYDISFCLQANKNKLKIGVYPESSSSFWYG